MTPPERESCQARPAEDFGGGEGCACQWSGIAGLCCEVIEEAPVLISLFRGAGEVFYVNRALAAWVGQPKSRIVGRSFLPMLPEEDRRRVEEKLVGLSPSAPEFVIEHRARRADGQTRWQRWTNRAGFDASGRLMYVIGIGNDVTDLKQAQEALRQSEERFRLIVEHSGDMFYVHTPDHVLTYVSPQCREFLGYEPAETRRRWMEFVTDHPANRVAYEITCRAIETGQPQPPYEVQLKRADGSTMWAEVHESPVVRDGRTVAIVGALRDITERKRLEEERRLLEAQWVHQARLESLGTLAGGLAHEINNPLNGMLNYAELIRAAAPQGSDLAGYAAEIQREGERVARVVRSLLSFAREEPGRPEPVLPAELVGNVLALVRSVLLEEHIRCEVEVPDTLPPLRCSPQEIQQVLMHLLNNARDALNARFPGRHEQKRLRIAGVSFEENGEAWVRLSVEDWGEGIPPDVRQRMFEPFYTTRPRARYSGLGLSVSLGIVRRHRGRLCCESPEGGPTRFDVELPVAGPSVDRSRP
ncbi:MAG: PAS domain-containing sensor histidine kinase [Verrucomicrobia bacterium]|nr:MAG: PAS domain-containing sensor histidine kinase [Verrucomicrobiota bacterium]